MSRSASHTSSGCALVRISLRIDAILRAPIMARRCFFSPPPCGEGSGVGVEGYGISVPHGTTPLPNPPPQGGREPRRSRSLTAVSLDPITLGIDNKGRVVVRTVVGAQPRFAVVATAVYDRCSMKGIDAVARLG